MEKRSRRRTRDLVTQAASQGLSENEIGCARISMMARSTNAPCKGRIQMRKTNPLHLLKFGLQRTAGPYSWVNRVILEVADDFRSSPGSGLRNGLRHGRWACLKGANSGSRCFIRSPRRRCSRTRYIPSAVSSHADVGEAVRALVMVRATIAASSPTPNNSDERRACVGSGPHRNTGQVRPSPTRR